MASEIVSGNQRDSELHQRKALEPINISELSAGEKKKALNCIIFIPEKRSGEIKARTVVDGSPQGAYINKEDAASPTVMVESILLTATIEAKEERDVFTYDVPNAFLQTKVNLHGERVFMKIKGPLVDMLVTLDPQRYRSSVVLESSVKVLYVRVLKAIYGLLQSILFLLYFLSEISSGV